MWSLLKKINLLLRYNPASIFIYGILAKWYLIIATLTIITTYWGLKTLKDAGVITKVDQILRSSLDDTQIIAKYCLPKLFNQSNLSEFFRCTNQVDQYKSALEQDRQRDSRSNFLINNMNKIINQIDQKAIENTKIDQRAIEDINEDVVDPYEDKK